MDGRGLGLGNDAVWLGVAGGLVAVGFGGERRAIGVARSRRVREVAVGEDGVYLRTVDGSGAEWFERWRAEGGLHGLGQRQRDALTPRQSLLGDGQRVFGLSAERVVRVGAMPTQWRLPTEHFVLAAAIAGEHVAVVTHGGRVAWSDGLGWRLWTLECWDGADATIAMAADDERALIAHSSARGAVVWMMRRAAASAPRVVWRDARAIVGAALTPGGGLLLTSDGARIELDRAP